MTSGMTALPGSMRGGTAQVPRLPIGLQAVPAGTEGDVPHLSARVWTIGTDLAEPMRVTFNRRLWRARCPPGRRSSRGEQRACSDANRIWLGSHGSSESASVSPQGARAIAEARAAPQRASLP